MHLEHYLEHHLEHLEGRMNALTTAENWLKRGVATIPVVHKSKKPAIKWSEFQKRLPTNTELRNWYRMPRNVAVVTGWRGLTVLDFDDTDAYIKWRLWASCRDGISGFVATHSYQVRTARGVHVYVRLPQATRTRPLLAESKERIGIDIKSRGGYVIAPPSIHPSGSTYRTQNHNAVIPAIMALSDVLPLSLLVLPSNTEYAGRGIREVGPAGLLSTDPWETAERGDYSSEDLVSAIRSRFKIEDLFAASERTGNGWLRVRCPLHDDNDPSMWIDTQRQICGCFAGCTPRPLDVINLWSRIHDLTNTEAIFDLGRRL